MFEENADCDEGPHPSHQALATLIYTMPHMVCCKVPKHTSHTLAIMVRHRVSPFLGHQQWQHPTQSQYNTIQLIQHNTIAITRERDMDDDHDVVGEGDDDNLKQMFPVSIYTTN